MFVSKSHTNACRIEPCLLLLRSIELYLDSHHLRLLSGNKGSLAGVNRVDVHDISLLLANGKGL